MSLVDEKCRNCLHEQESNSFFIVTRMAVCALNNTIVEVHQYMKDGAIRQMNVTN